MAFLEGSKGVSTSIGGSTQTVNFNPVLNARGASSGPITNEGIRQQQAPTVTNQQNSGTGDGGTPINSGMIPRLNLASNPAEEAGNPGYLSPQSFVPGALPKAGAVLDPSSGSMLLPVLALAAVALVVIVSMR